MLLRAISMVIAGLLFYSWRRSEDTGRRVLAWIAGIWLFISLLTLAWVFLTAFGY